MNGSKKKVEKVCNIPSFGGDEGWFSKSALTNIHGLSEVIGNGHHVIFDSEKHNGFVINFKAGEVLTFLCDERGIYTKDAKPMVNWCLIEVQGFSPREVARAKRYKRLLHDLDAPSSDDLEVVICLNLIKNNPVIY